MLKVSTSASSSIVNGAIKNTRQFLVSAASRATRRSVASRQLSTTNNTSLLSSLSSSKSKIVANTTTTTTTGVRRGDSKTSCDARAVASTRVPTLRLFSSLAQPSNNIFGSCMIPQMPNHIDLASIENRSYSGNANNGGNDVSKHVHSIVKIFNVYQKPNFELPWQKKPSRECSGTGFFIGNRRILTCAHVCDYSAHVEVRKHGSSQKYKARIIALGHECDLALLTVDDDEFWEGAQPLEFSRQFPMLQQSVAAVGFSQHGDQISVSVGVVYRIETQRYLHGSKKLLAIQVDSSIESGTSGGPVIMNNAVVGVAFMASNKIGWIIPIPVVEHFLKNVEIKNKEGFCSLGIFYQEMHNASLRKYYRIDNPIIDGERATTNTTNDAPALPSGIASDAKKNTGVLVTKVRPLSPADGALLPGDVLLRFDGKQIGNDGTVVFDGYTEEQTNAIGLRISFDDLASRKLVGQSCTLSILREGRPMDVTVKLNVSNPLVPYYNFETSPSYFIHAGLVFTPLTVSFLKEWGEDYWDTAPRALVYLLEKDKKEKDEEIVVLSHVLIDDINSGYQDFEYTQVVKVNGVNVKNMSHLIKLIEGAHKKKAPFIRLDVQHFHRGVIVLDAEEALKASPRILARNDIPYDRSKNFRELGGGEEATLSVDGSNNISNNETERKPVVDGRTRAGRAAKLTWDDTAEHSPFHEEHDQHQHQDEPKQIGAYDDEQ
eukprot:GEZU01029429.1.p1 GENE.GEZU01029429.1~~GEZU01029429.1.p1  ORF type:complete len:717 (-),score=237.36 GEZU01029429.1:6-2156(-)